MRSAFQLLTRCRLEPWVPLGVFCLGACWVPAGCLLGASWVTPGTSWVPPGCLERHPPVQLLSPTLGRPPPSQVPASSNSSTHYGGGDLVDAADTAANDFVEKLAQGQTGPAQSLPTLAASGSAQRPLHLGPADAAQKKVVTCGRKTRVLFPCAGILRTRVVAAILAYAALKVQEKHRTSGRRLADGKQRSISEYADDESYTFIPAHLPALAPFSWTNPHRPKNYFIPLLTVVTLRDPN